LVRYCRSRTAGLGHVRADVCDTYRTYLNCIDLTKTGLAIPVVDELATIPLDLWAHKDTISVYIANKKQIMVPGARHKRSATFHSQFSRLPIS
jgi:formate dehydrogenase maturation protein FdhE